MVIAQWMSRSPACVRPDDTLAAAKKLMDAGRFRRLPAVESDKLICIITERDLRQHCGYLDATKVNAVMTPGPPTVTPRDTAENAARLMLQHNGASLS
jgi:CBS domain-containing protein